MARQTIDRLWWRKNKAKIFEGILSVARLLESNQAARDNDSWRFARQYGGLVGNDLLLGLKHFVSAASNQTAKVPRFSYNVTKAVVDTSVAKITAVDVKPTFVTDGGSWHLRRKAKKLDKLCQGIFYAAKMRVKGPTIFRDGAVFGTGVVKVYEEDGRILLDRTLPTELMVDDLDGMHQEPRQLFQRKVISREVLLELYPEARVAIEAAPRYTKTGDDGLISDAVLVYEAWHLPSGEDATDGRWAACVETGTLFSERWDKHYFPFAFFRYQPRLLGFWGLGLVESGFQIQVEINRINRVIQEALYFLAVGRIFLPLGSKLVPSHLSTVQGAVVEVAGDKMPVFSPGGGINPQVLEYRDDLYRKYFELAGVSQMAAQNLKPAGIDSAVALRAYADNQSERFNPIAKAYEQFYLDVAAQVINLARDIYSRTGSYKVKVPDKAFLRTIDWKEVDLENEKFELKVFPTNALPSTPEGRMATVQNLMQANLIKPEAGRRLLDFPDLEGELEMEDSDLNVIDRIIDGMLEDGDYESPEPFLDLAMAFARSRQAYNRAKVDGAPEDRLELLRRFNSEIGALQKRSAAAAAANQAPPGGGGGAPGPGGPQAKPTAPPTSDLLPNAPGAAA